MKRFSGKKHIFAFDVIILKINESTKITKMNFYKYLLLILTLKILSFNVIAQDIVVVGHVVSRGEHLPFVNIYLDGTQIGTTTDVTGHFMMVDLPAGEYDLVARTIGYKIQKQSVKLIPGTTIEVNFEMEADVLRVDEVVVTGTKTFKRQTESAVIVNVMDARAIQSVAANTVSDILNFQPGLRMEVDCQTCNYTQLRMNGLGGAYSQILVNSRPVISPLTGLYGLEQLPAQMVERIEVVRGGASALYGSSAIGGTVNIITKIPERSAYEITTSGSSVNGSAMDYNMNGTVTVLSQKRNSGVSLYTSHRQREAYDHNDDGFSELPKLGNNSFGLNSFFKTRPNHKLEVSFSSMHEFRRGGNAMSQPAYLALQSEERTHTILMGGIDYEILTRNNQDSWIIYVAGQNTTRDHFTGIAPDTAEELIEYRADPPYGDSKNHTLQIGNQYNHRMTNFITGINMMTFGAELNLDNTMDRIDSYDYLIDQETRNLGVFAQSDWSINSNWTLLTGIRGDYHNFVEKLILNPRVSLLFRPDFKSQMRLSWSTGFRAPQAFDADMHIAFAGGGIQRVQLSPDLREERSQSLSASWNFDHATENYIVGFTLEGFMTNLNHAFILEEISVDEDGNSIMEKRNGSKSDVYGGTFEARWNYNQRLQVESGITLQKSLYGEPVQWSGQLPGVKEYLRTPDSYGYFTMRFMPRGPFEASLSGIYTGTMKIPHYGVPGDPGTPETDELFNSPSTWDINSKLSYRFDFPRIDSSIELFGGVSNMLNDYQNNFDKGKNRDSGFVYGPAKPRTIFFGIRLFN
jgi:outer membrane receptor for ferrienterochelin and colicins